MSDEEMRVAIAEACGWEWWRFPDANNVFFQLVRPGQQWPSERYGGVKCGRPKCWVNESKNAPDYLNDLNAMHAAEEILVRDDKWLDYVLKLLVICDPAFSGWTSPKSVGATARQRAEAFLRTLGKFKEEARATPSKHCTPTPI